MLIDWRADVAEPAAVRRFAGALSAGLRGTVAMRAEAGGVIAGVSLGGSAARHWRARPLPGGGWLGFTGFIANADNLAADLDLAGADAADLYAAGYARWGDAIDLRAVGEFATLMLTPDATLRAARSPILAPPLHFRWDRHRVVIASTPRAVLAGFDLPAEVDEQKIADSLWLNYAEAERGWYRGVTRLDTGCRTWFTPASASAAPRRYYDLFDARPVRLRRDEDYVETADALLADGVRGVLAGHHRPAISLSGGLDSQAVAVATVAARPGEPLLGLTAVPMPGFEPVETARSFEDERSHVAALTAMYPQIDSQLVDAAEVPLDYRLAAMFLMAGAAPRNVLNFPWLHAVHDRAVAAGCDVLLTGAMGNIGFSFDGGGALPSWLARGRWARLARELWHRRRGFGLMHVAARDAAMPLLPRAIQMRLRRTDAIDPQGRWSPIAHDYAAAMDVRQRRGPIDDAHWPDTLAHRRAMLTGLGEIGDIRQGFAAIHGIPMRDPTAYRPLLEFCVAIPDSQYLRSGQPRWLAKRLLRGQIPDAVVDERRRGRQAADAPARLGRVHAELLAEVQSLARDPAMARRFDLPRLSGMLAAWTPGTRFNAAESDALRLALPRTIATARFIRYVEGSNHF